MKLSPKEEELVNALRDIDKANPLGIDAFTEETHIAICLQIVRGAAQEAGRRYRLFLKQSKTGTLIDLREAQRSKTRADDPRA